MLNVWTFKLLAVLVIFVATVRSLECYDCEYNTAKQKPLCQPIVKKCQSNQAYCLEIILVNQINNILYGKSCADENSCRNPDEACKEKIRKQNLTSCSIKCCQGNLCKPKSNPNPNPANVITPCGMLFFMMAALYCIFV